MPDNNFTNLSFHGIWRDYQKRVLDNSISYLSDNKIHIVAAPGSGKTVLGIELMKRLGKPSLILSPSLAIRDQWIERLCSDFGAGKSVISTSLKEPGLITIVTYQALYSFDTIKCFGTIILDEAHHLRREWWNALSDMLKAVNNITVISLTATPPYDASASEWNKYISLCGPIDEEITIPELVKEGSLCPHQDFIYLSEPDKQEAKIINKIYGNAQKIYSDVLNDEEFHRAIMSHSVVLDTNTYADLFLDNMEFALSFFVYARYIDDPVYIRLKWLIGEATPIPNMNIHYLETLLQGFLYDYSKSFHYDATYSDKLREIIEANSLVHKKKVQLTKNDRISYISTRSISKLQSICEIVKSEHQTLGNSLRLLIVTDYIKREFLKALTDSSYPLTDTGVIPIFEALRRYITLTMKQDSINFPAGDSLESNIPWFSEANLRMGVLTGSLVIIPFEALSKANELAKEKNISLEYSPLEQTGYYTISSPSNIITSIITKLFCEGYIKVLIGTASLLGEGWDAPCINSLIFASNISSYVTSNQIRGRAIRVDKDIPDKNANIWHLACIPQSDFDELEDMALLTQRFKGFMGLCYDNPSIENGIERLSCISVSDISGSNSRTMEKSRERSSLKASWDIATTNVSGYFSPTKNETMLSKDSTPAYILRRKSTVKLIISLLGTALAAGLAAFIHNSISDNMYLFIFLCGTAVCFGDMLIKSLNKTVYYRNNCRMLLGFGTALLNALRKTNKLSPDSSLSVKTDYNTSNELTSVYLSGGAIREKELFQKCIYDFFMPIGNQRYILRSEAKLPGEYMYFPVPDIFSKNKKDAEEFSYAVNSAFAKYKLIYTRNEDGRKELMKALRTSYYSKKNFKVEKKDRI